MSTKHPDEIYQGNKIIRCYDQSGFFKDFSVDELIAQKLNQFRGWQCSAGLLHLYVDFDGFVYIGNCRQGGHFGNVFDDFELPTEWVTCKTEFCGCGGDFLAPKAKLQHSDKLFITQGLVHSGSEKRMSQVKEIVATETAFPKSKITIQWDIGRRCNFDCSYCWPYVHSKTEPLKQYQDLKLASERLFKKFGLKKKFMFQIGGGEPTIYPDFLSWVKFLKLGGHDVVLTSNGSRNHTFWREMIQYANVNLSVHFEFANLDNFHRNVSAIIDEKKQNPLLGGLEVKIMCPPGKVEIAKSFFDRLMSIPSFKDLASASLVPVRYPSREIQLASKVQDYSVEELKWLQDQP